MPKQRPKAPTHRDAVFASDILEAKRDQQQLGRKAVKWKLQLQKTKKKLEGKSDQLKQQDPSRQL